MKRIPTIILTCLLVLSFTVYVFARSERSKIEYYEKQTFKSDTEHQKEMKFGPNAEITSDSKNFNPRNYINNSLFSIWSGGSQYGVGGVTCVPDGWYIQGTHTGVTRVDAPDVASGSGSTIYPGYPHSLQIATWNPSTGPGTTAYFTYPDSGVSNQAAWFKQFAGSKVVFGAFIKRDVGQYVASGVSTNFIRPYICTYSPVNALAGETSYAFGPYQEYNGWQMLSAVTTVPVGATAIEFGFAMNPTVLGPVATGGDTAYITAPFFLINPIRTEYVPKQQEIVFLKKSLNVLSGGSDFGAKLADDAGCTLDLSVDTGWEGIIPDSVSDICTTIRGDFVALTDPLHIYGDDIQGGVTFYPHVAAGVASFNNVWVPVSSSGTITIDSIAAITGVSIIVEGVKIR